MKRGFPWNPAPRPPTEETEWGNGGGARAKDNGFAPVDQTPVAICRPTHTPSGGERVIERKGETRGKRDKAPDEGD